MALDKKLTLADFLPSGALLTYSATLEPPPLRGLHDATAAMYNHAGMPPAQADTLKEAQQYAKRDAAWQAYYAEHHLENRGHNSMVVAAIHDGFNTGWEARKRIVDYALDTSKKP